MKFIVVGYYTLGTFYEDMSRVFISSLKKYEVSYYVEGIKSLGNWNKNTNYKPTFVKNMMKKFPKHNIVYIDCDAVLLSYPKLFEGIDDNIAVYVFDKSLHKKDGCKGTEILSGTIFLQNTEEVYKIVEQWESMCQKRQKQYDQKSLEMVIGSNFFKLPPEYCVIFDLMCHIKNPIIVHYQASRQVRRKGGIENCVIQESLPQVLSNR